MAGKLRITGGILLKSKFYVPKEADDGLVRPASDKVREAIFSSLYSYSMLKNSFILDLFAGSGSYSFEAISRGAKLSTLIEKKINIVNCIKKNIKILKLNDKCRVIINDVFNFILKKHNIKYNLIFVDPPYCIKVNIFFWENLKSLLTSNGMIIYRCYSKESFFKPNGYKIIRSKTYGGTYVAFLAVN